jgi:hypothetical protein
MWSLDALKTRSEHPGPVLLWESASTDEVPVEHWMKTETGSTPTRPRGEDALVFRIEKAAQRANAFSMGVTIGRVDSNDIVIDDRSISRFHAWLQFDVREQTWMLTDAESKNGTWVGGVKLEPKKRVPLKSGIELRLGDMQLRFLDAGALFELVEAFWTRLSGQPKPKS